MSINSDYSQKTLQEVATLLLILHEHYFKDVPRDSVLNSMMSFIWDLNLLGNTFSILDVGRIHNSLDFHRQDSIQRVENDAGLISYQGFYNWLRMVALILYENNDDGKKCVHKLLTQYVVPLAIRTAKNESTSNICVKEMIISKMVHYDSFLRLWYIDIIVSKGGSYSHKLNRRLPVRRIWKKISYDRNLISSYDVQLQFKQVGICPKYCTEEDINLIMNQILPSLKPTKDNHISGTNIIQLTSSLRQEENSDNNISFSIFLLILHGVIEFAYMNHVLKTKNDDRFHDLSSTTSTIFQIVSAHLLDSTLKRFYTADQSFLSHVGDQVEVQIEGFSAHHDPFTSGVHPTHQLKQAVNQSIDHLHIIPVDSDIPPSVLHQILTLRISSVMWLMRQGGFFYDSDSPVEEIPSEGGRIASRINEFRPLTLHRLAILMRDWLLERQPNSSLPLNMTLNSNHWSKTASDAQLRLERVFTSENISDASSFPMSEISDLLQYYIQETITSFVNTSTQQSPTHTSSIHAISHQSDNTLQNGTNTSWIMNLMLYLPGLLFAKPLSSPSAFLYHLYTLRTSYYLNDSILDEFETLIHSCTIRPFAHAQQIQQPATIYTKNNQNDASHEKKMSLLAFYQLCEELRIIPLLINQNILTLICEYILGFAIQTEKDLSVTSHDLLEIFFVISQVAYGGRGEVESINESFRSYQRNIKCFKDPKERLHMLFRFCMPRFHHPLSPVPSTTATVVAPAPQSGSTQSAPISGNGVSMSLQPRSTVRPEDALVSQTSSEMGDIVKASTMVTSSTAELASTIDELSAMFYPALTTGWGLLAPHPEAPLQVDTNRAIEDVELLLIHFPINDVSFTPWKVRAIFETIQPVLYSPEDLNYFLNQVFRAVSDLLHLRVVDLTAFYYNLCGVSGGLLVLKPTVRVALVERELRLIRDERVLQLLRSNQDLIRFEFYRCSSTHRSDNPFSIGVLSPVPSTATHRSRPDDVLVSTRAALYWATTIARIAEENASIHLDSTFLLAGLFNESGAVNGYLTYASFIIFMIRCFGQYEFRELGRPHHNDHEKEAEVMLNAARNLIHRLSEHLSTIQSTCGIRVLKPLLGSSEGKAKSPLIDDLECHAMFRQMILLFDMKNPIKKRHDNFSFIPAPVSTKLWDAPKFVYFCKMYGLVSSVGSFLTIWKSFGYHLRKIYSPQRLSQWVDGIVPPLPLKVCVEAFTSLIDSVAKHFDQKSWQTKASDGVSIGTQNLLVQVLIPMVVAIADIHAVQPTESVDTTDANSGSYAEVRLDDLLRYGGAWMMSNFAEHRAFMISAFKGLVHSSGMTAIGEPLLSHVCRYLSCQGLLQTGLVANLLKTSIHPRLRKLRCTSAWKPSEDTIREELTLSFAEFEEIMIRCAFASWDISGASRGRAFASCFITYRPGSSPRAQEVIRTYCDECCGNKTEIRGGDLKIESDTLLGLPPHLFGEKWGSWGIDFVTPYVKTLLVYGLIPGQITSIIHPTNTQFLDNNAKKILKPLPVNDEVISKGRNPADRSDETNSLSYRLYKLNSDQSDVDQGDWATETDSERRVQGPSLKANGVPSKQGTTSESSLLSITSVVVAVAESPSKPQKDARLEDSMQSESPLFTTLLQSPQTPSMLYVSPSPDKSPKDVSSPTTNSHVLHKSLVDATSNDLSSSRQTTSLDSAELPITGGVAAANRAQNNETFRAKVNTSQIFLDPITESRKSKILQEIISSRSGQQEASDDRYRAEFSTQSNAMKTVNATGTLNDTIPSFFQNIPPQPAYDGRVITPSSTPSILYMPITPNEWMSRSNFHTRGELNGGGLGFIPDTEEKYHPHSQQTPIRFEGNNQERIASILSRGHLEGTREALWPVFSTFCSCSDSSEPGKLFGPNLITLLSKLGVLSEVTPLSDIGFLLHDVTALTMSQAPLVIQSDSDDFCDSPSLSFDEFLFFLYKYASLVNGVETNEMPPIKSHELWKNSDSDDFRKVWDALLASEERQVSSAAFRRLFEERILPQLKRSPLPASPQDARDRDRFNRLFTIELLTAIGRVEEQLKTSFQKLSQRIAEEDAEVNPSIALGQSSGFGIPAGVLLNILLNLKLIPQVLGMSEAKKLVEDIIPTDLSSHPVHMVMKNEAKSFSDYSAPITTNYSTQKSDKQVLNSVQLEWVICMVSLTTVEIAIRECKVEESEQQVKDFGTLIAGVLRSIADAI